MTTIDVCAEFFRDPTRNPRTGRSIKYGGPVYKQLVAECGDPEKPKVKDLPKLSPKPFKLEDLAKPTTIRELPSVPLVDPEITRLARMPVPAGAKIAQPLPRYFPTVPTFPLEFPSVPNKPLPNLAKPLPSLPKPLPSLPTPRITKVAEFSYTTELNELSRYNQAIPRSELSEAVKLLIEFVVNDLNTNLKETKGVFEVILRPLRKNYQVTIPPEFVERIWAKYRK